MEAAGEGGGLRKSSTGIEVIAGITVFFACAYIVFFAPATLSAIGFDYGAVVTATCLACVAGCLAVAAVPRLPNVLAPATAIIYLSVDAVRAKFGAEVPAAEAVAGVLAASLGAGLCVFVVSILPSARHGSQRVALLELVPPPLQAAVVSGIGGLLAGSAMRSVGGGRTAAVPDGSRLDAIVFVVGVALIILIELSFKRAAHKVRRESPAQGRKAALLELGSSSAILVSILFMIAASPLLQDFQAVPAFAIGVASGLDDVGALWDLREDGWVLGLGLAMLFTLLIDFVGSPYDFRQLAESEAARPSEAQVRSGYWTDAAMMVAMPFIGLTPSVYFGENHAGRLAGGRTWRVALVAGGLFAGLGVLIVVSSLLGWRINAFISPFVLAPAIFWIGIKIIGERMIVSYDEESIRLSPKNVTIPAAISSVVGAVYSFPAAIFLGFSVYLVLVCLDSRSEGLSLKEWPVFALTVLAGVTAALSG